MARTYLALAWAAAADAPARTHSEALRASGTWQRRLREPGLEVWTLGDLELPVADRADLGAVVIGRMFGKPTTPDASPALSPASPAREVARRLLQEAWGEYVALIRDPVSNRVSALRDPSGAIEAVTWVRDGVAVVASEIDHLPFGLAPAHLRMDWDVLTAVIREPLVSAARSPLEGLHTIAPGDLQPLGASAAEATALWRPSTWAQAPQVAGPEQEVALRTAVETAVAALVSAYPSCLLEVSGGLDSAIVATTLARAGLTDRVAGALHLQDGRAEGDELAWADHVFRRLGMTPTVQPLGIALFDGDPFAAFAAGARPPLNAIDPGRGGGTQRIVAATRAQAVVTGKGGDAVFFQMPNRLVAADYLQAVGLHRMFDGTARGLARWLRGSIWSMTCDALRALRRGLAADAPSPLWGERLWSAPKFEHPWLTGMNAAPPGKRAQVQAILHNQLRRGVNPVVEAADLIHPLLSQPVLEAVLPIATWDLVRGGRERGLARAVFADRVPEAILARRSKGQLSAYFAKLVASNLDFLRPHLIDGCLADAGVLDRRALEAALTEDALIWQADAVDLLNAAAVESWVRHWQRLAPDSPATPRLLTVYLD